MVTLAVALGAVLTLVLTFVVGAPPAHAGWNVGSTAAGYAAGRSVGVPTNATATSTAPTSIRVSWSAPSGSSVAPDQYVVRRISPTAATVCTVATSTFECDDTGLSPSTAYRYTVEARVGTNWTSGPTGAVSATTPSPTFVVITSGASQTAGSPFTVTLTATSDGTATDTSYTGSHAITFSGPSNGPNGTAPIYPASVVFANGVGTATVTLVDAETATLQASDGTRVGTASLTVTAGSGVALTYTSSNVSCAAGSVRVGNGGSFISKVSLVDTYGNAAGVAATTSVSITRSAVIGTLSPTSIPIPVPASESSAGFTFTLSKGNPPDVTITASASGYTPATCIVRK